MNLLKPTDEWWVSNTFEYSMFPLYGFIIHKWKPVRSLFSVFFIRIGLLFIFIVEDCLWPDLMAEDLA